MSIFPVTANKEMQMFSFEPIYGEDEWTLEPGESVIYHTEIHKISELLMGHKVTKADDEHLVLDDGTVLKIVGNEGCSPTQCPNGYYELTELNGVDNIITRVEFAYSPANDEGKYDGYYKVFVYAENKKVNLLTVEGSDGNGYYGTGFEIFVRPVVAEPKPTKRRVKSSAKKRRKRKMRKQGRL